MIIIKDKKMTPGQRFMKAQIKEMTQLFFKKIINHPGLNRLVTLINIYNYYKLNELNIRVPIRALNLAADLKIPQIIRRFFDTFK